MYELHRNANFHSRDSCISNEYIFLMELNEYDLLSWEVLGNLLKRSYHHDLRERAFLMVLKVYDLLDDNSVVAAYIGFVPVLPVVVFVLQVALVLQFLVFPFLLFELLLAISENVLENLLFGIMKRS